MPIDMECDCVARVVSRGNQQGDQVVDVVALACHHWRALRDNNNSRSTDEVACVSLPDRVKDGRALSWLDLWQADTVDARRTRRRLLGGWRCVGDRRRRGQCGCRWRGIRRARVECKRKAGDHGGSTRPRTSKSAAAMHGGIRLARCHNRRRVLAQNCLGLGIPSSPDRVGRPNRNHVPASPKHAAGEFPEHATAGVSVEP